MKTELHVVIDFVAKNENEAAELLKEIADAIVDGEREGVGFEVEETDVFNDDE